jgi:hypothetical protein
MAYHTCVGVVYLINEYRYSNHGYSVVNSLKYTMHATVGQEQYQLLVS